MKFFQSHAVLILIGPLIVVLSLMSDSFLTARNLLNILNQNAPLAIIASAMTLVIILGGFDLSVGAIFAMGSVASASLAVRVNRCLGPALAPLVGLAFGYANGPAIAKLRVHFFLATIATALIFRGIAVAVSDGRLISARIDEFIWLGCGKVLGVYNSVRVMVIFALLPTFLLTRNTFGRRVFPVGGNEEAAILSGIRTNRVKVATFAIAGFAAGLASIVTTSRIALGQTSAGEGMELQAIAAVILGGTSIYCGQGAVWRPLAGVFLLALVNNGFNIHNIAPFFRDLTMGLIILAAVALSAMGDRR